MTKKDSQKTEKYKNWIHYFSAFFYREWLRYRLKPLVSWKNVGALDEGCTAVLGMCSRLPNVLAANLECFESAVWPELKELIIAVDSKEGVLSSDFVSQIKKRFHRLNIRFVYYDDRQHRIAEKLKLPYVYCWMSWIVAMREAKTKTVFIHDYDALILSDILGRRYHRFIEKKSRMQGVLWYWVNGLTAEDRLASTFEAFLDMEWARAHHPIRMINQIGLLAGRRVDFDILTEMQANLAEESARDIVEMGFDDLIHPTQMIHQYTVARKHPGKAWYCASLIMIPFFHYLSGQKNALAESTSRIRATKDKTVELLGDGCLMNFSWLEPSQLDWMLKQILQVFVKKNVPPFLDMFEYGNAFYEWMGIAPSDRWVHGFDDPHRQWISAAQLS